jgi:hypothetical protein
MRRRSGVVAAMPQRDVEEGAGRDEAAAAAMATVRMAAEKIRKRRELSSSGASDPAAARRRLRSRRPSVLLPRRQTNETGRGQTPTRSGGDMSESSRSQHCRGRNRVADGTRPSASATRLVAAFWQMDKDMLFEGDEAVVRRSVVPWSGASTEVSLMLPALVKIHSLVV